MSYGTETVSLLSATVSALLVFVLAGSLFAYQGRPELDRIFPLGGQRGSTVTVELRGNNLSNANRVEFDCEDLRWIKTTGQSAGYLRGEIAIDSEAALGPHFVRLWSIDGYSTTILFNVGQFRDVIDMEPNDSAHQAQFISGDVEIQGRLEPASDIDVYSIEVNKGERWVMNLRAIEHGSLLAGKMEIFDSEGHQVVSNDDRNDYLETPFLEHIFEKTGSYRILVDRYRGPRGQDFNSNSAYMMRLSRLPTIDYVTPLGASVGASVEIQLNGNLLETIEQVYLSEVRSAEYMRMTYPYTMPIHMREDPPKSAGIARIAGFIKRHGSERLVASFAIPANVRTGMWRLWASGSRGTVEATYFEISDTVEYSEFEASTVSSSEQVYAVNGGLLNNGEYDQYPIRAIAGRPLHYWTLATQLGVPHLDPVLTLYDDAGVKIAENDDTVGAYGNLVGNPDSSLFYTPTQDGPLILIIKDRTSRGGPSYRYRLKADSRLPTFQLFTTPENFTVERGGQAEIKIHMPRETGFDGEVVVWFEGLPEGVKAPRSRFRKDQTFEPSADGADMIIPEVSLIIKIPESVAVGAYPIRVLGVEAQEELMPERRIVEANTCSQMGPLVDLWNFTRRPLPKITLTVVEPPKISLSAVTSAVSVFPGQTANISVRTMNLPQQTRIEVRGLPEGVSFEVGKRDENNASIQLKAAPKTQPGYFDISVESKNKSRWATTALIKLRVEKKLNTVH